MCIRSIFYPAGKSIINNGNDYIVMNINGADLSLFDDYVFGLKWIKVIIKCIINRIIFKGDLNLAFLVIYSRFAFFVDKDKITCQLIYFSIFKWFDYLIFS